jgi:hypothetical protein
MQLSADEISSIIKKQIQNFDRASVVGGFAPAPLK